MTGNLHEQLFTFMIIPRSFLRRMRNASDKSCREHQNTHFMCSNVFFEILSFYEMMWNNMVKPDRE
jgi:hypothetical protein